MSFSDENSTKPSSEKNIYYSLGNKSNIFISECYLGENRTPAIVIRSFFPKNWLRKDRKGSKRLVPSSKHIYICKSELKPLQKVIQTLLDKSPGSANYKRNIFFYPFKFPVGTIHLLDGSTQNIVSCFLTIISRC